MLVNNIVWEPELIVGKLCLVSIFHQNSLLSLKQCCIVDLEQNFKVQNSTSQPIGSKIQVTPNFKGVVCNLFNKN